MATDFSEKERAFTEALKAETGHDLKGWMRAIDVSGMGHRNDIIDWLRQQGFMFARASWLERIHHNGGRLIYGNTPARLTGSPQAAVTRTSKAALPVRRTPNCDDDAAVDALLAGAKAYRALATVVLRDILAAVPGADAEAHAGYIAVSHGQPFAALLPSARDVRLLLALGPIGAPGGWQKAKIAGTAVEILGALTHMIVLTDARQLTRELRELVVVSARNCPA